MEQTLIMIEFWVFGFTLIIHHSLYQLVILIQHLKQRQSNRLAELRSLTIILDSRRKQSSEKQLTFWIVAGFCGPLARGPWLGINAADILDTECVSSNSAALSYN